MKKVEADNKEKGRGTTAEGSNDLRPSSAQARVTSPVPKGSKATMGAPTTSTPTNPTENWRETDKRFHAEVAEDKKRHAAGKKPVGSGTVMGPSGNPILGVVEEIEVAVVLESGSTPNVAGVVILHQQRPMDPNTLPEEESPDYSKYVQCPHCGRKFEPLAADRHIPQCEEYYFNKEEKDKFKKAQPKK